MSKTSSALVQRLWNYCNLLRDDGLSYGDYVEQLTYLLFLKMAWEQTKGPNPKASTIPETYNWPSLMKLDGERLETRYRRGLEELGKQKGMLGLIFRKALNKIQDPAKLRRLIVELIDKVDWSSLSADVKGDAYEGLLEKNAQDTKGGAGQYFTPRPVIEAIVEVIRPQPDEKICDPACGTGGFLLEAHRYIDRNNPNLDKRQKRHLKLHALRGVELVDSVTRLCAMNLLLHGIGPTTEAEGEPPVRTADSLGKKPEEKFEVVLTNPPFGKKSSVTFVNEDEDEDEKQALTVVRTDFDATTSNKQLNFLQHVKSLLKENGRAAVVVPDNVLFEGGAGETIRRKLLEECNVHTLLRLPTGIFYAQGVKANVLFFDRKGPAATAWTKQLWIYDLRTNKHFTLRTRPLQYDDLKEFVECYKADNTHLRKPTWSENQPDGRWRVYSYEELIQRDKLSLDIFWLRDESLESSDNLPDADIIAEEIADDLRAALSQFEEIQADLRRGKKQSVVFAQASGD